MAASSNPAGSSVGRSFSEWTAKSTRPAARASSISLVKIPLPMPPLVPTMARGTSVILSPVVWMSSISTWCPRARRRAEMWLACQRASCEPREPMRRLGMVEDTRQDSTLDILPLNGLESVFYQIVGGFFKMAAAEEAAVGGKRRRVRRFQHFMFFFDEQRTFFLR